MDTKTIKVDSQVTEQILTDIFEEIFKAGRIPDIGFIRHILRSMLHKPVTNFSQFIARLDALIRDHGFVEAAGIAIDELSGGFRAVGAYHIPQSGPVIIASNHPGTYDGFALIANLQRDDFKIMVSGVPFFRNLPNASKYLIYSTQDVNDRMQAIRQSIAHLRAGGALLIFPSGRIDPDPAVLPGAEKALSQWSRSILVFMRKVQDASLVLAITSGVLSKEITTSLYPKFFRNDHERRRVMEFMQVIRQMVRGKPVSVNPRVSFAKPISQLFDLNADPDKLQAQIHQQATALLQAHQAAFSLPRF